LELARSGARYLGGTFVMALDQAVTQRWLSAFLPLATTFGMVASPRRQCSLSGWELCSFGGRRCLRQTEAADREANLENLKFPFAY